MSYLLIQGTYAGYLSMLGSSEESGENFPSFQAVLILNLGRYHWIQYLG